VAFSYYEKFTSKLNSPNSFELLRVNGFLKFHMHSVHVRDVCLIIIHTYIFTIINMLNRDSGRM